MARLIATCVLILAFAEVSVVAQTTLPQPTPPPRPTSLTQTIPQPLPNLGTHLYLRFPHKPQYVIDYQVFLDTDPASWKNEPAPLLRVTVSDVPSAEVNLQTFFLFRFDQNADIDKTGTTTFAVPYSVAVASVLALLRDAAIANRPVFIWGSAGVPKLLSYQNGAWSRLESVAFTNAPKIPTAPAPTVP